jgi:hypothetical protein|tara:strand:+ start:63 stop:179 length:117 start_codon:yes stop_codon:yes gene_type:complete
VLVHLQVLVYHQQVVAVVVRLMVVLMDLVVDLVVEVQE